MLHCWVRLLSSCFYLWDALSFRVFVGTGIWHDGVVISLISSLFFFPVSFCECSRGPVKKQKKGVSFGWAFGIFCFSSLLALRPFIVDIIVAMGSFTTTGLFSAIMGFSFFFHASPFSHIERPSSLGRLSKIIIITTCPFVYFLSFLGGRGNGESSVISFTYFPLVYMIFFYFFACVFFLYFLF